MFSLRQTFIEMTGLLLLGLLILAVAIADSLQQFIQLPSAVYQMNMIFLSILIEALPFVLIGVLIAGLIQIFITDRHIERWIPKNRFAAILMSCIVGACFPACECGIVPIVRRLVSKGVPIYAGAGFLLTGPLINPLVILSTYMAFGNDARIAFWRMGTGFIIALAVSLVISCFCKNSQLTVPAKLSCIQNHGQQGFLEKLISTLKHSVDEFFSMGKFLILGALAAAFFQTYVSTEDFAAAGTGPASSIAVMMGLAYILSLCSEADAFIAASFSNLFPAAAVMSFLVYGPMLDLKNTLMMLSVFKIKFVVFFSLLVTAAVFFAMLLFQQFT